jgi:hypothetical protein
MTRAAQEAPPPPQPEAKEAIPEPPNLFDVFTDEFVERMEQANLDPTPEHWLDAAAALELFRPWSQDPELEPAFAYVEAALDQQLLTKEEKVQGQRLPAEERTRRMALALGEAGDEAAFEPAQFSRQLQVRGLALTWERLETTAEAQNLAVAQDALAYLDRREVEGPVVDGIRHWARETMHREVLVGNFRKALEQPSAIAGELTQVELPNGRTWEFSPYEMHQFLISGEGEDIYAIESHLADEVKELSTLPDHRGRLYVHQQDLFSRLGVADDQRAQAEIRGLLVQWSEDFFVAANVVQRIWEPIKQGLRRKDPEADYTPLLRPPRRILPMLYGEKAGRKQLLDDVFGTLKYYVKIFPGNNVEKAFSERTLGSIRRIFKGVLYPFSRYLGGYAKEAFWLKRNFQEKLRPWLYINHIEEEMGNRLFGAGATDIVETQIDDIVDRRSRVANAIEELKEYGAIAQDFTFANRFHSERLDDYLRVLSVARVEDPTLVLIETKKGLVVKDLTTLEYSQGGEKTQRAGEVLRVFSQGEFFDLYLGDFGIFSPDHWEFQFSARGKQQLSSLLAGLAQKGQLSPENQAKILFRGKVDDLRQAREGKRSDIPLDVLGGVILHDGQEELWDQYGGWIGAGDHAFDLSFDVQPRSKDTIYWRNYRTIYAHLGRDAMLAKEVLRINTHKLLKRKIGLSPLPADFSRDGQCEVYLRDKLVESATITEEVPPLASGSQPGEDYVLDEAKMRQLLEDEYEEKVLASLATYGVVEEQGERKERIDQALRRTIDGFRSQLVKSPRPEYRQHFPGLFLAEASLTDERYQRISQAVERLVKVPFFPSLIESMVASAVYKTSVVTCILPRDKRERLAISSLVSDIPDPQKLRGLIEQAGTRGEQANLTPYVRNWLNMYAECASAVINGQDNLSLPVVLASILGAKDELMTALNAVASPTATKIVAFSGLMHSAVGDFGKDAIGEWLNRRAELVTSARQEGYPEPVMAQTRGLAATGNEVVMRQVFRWAPASNLARRIFNYARKQRQKGGERRTIEEISRERTANWMREKLGQYQKDRRTYYQVLQTIGLPVELL